MLLADCRYQHRHKNSRKDRGQTWQFYDGYMTSSLHNYDQEMTNTAHGACGVLAYKVIYGGGVLKIVLAE